MFSTSKITAALLIGCSAIIARISGANAELPPIGSLPKGITMINNPKNHELNFACGNTFIIPGGKDHYIPNPDEGAKWESICGVEDGRVINLCTGKTVEHLPSGSKMINPLEPEVDGNLYQQPLKSGLRIDREKWCRDDFRLTRTIVLQSKDKSLLNQFFISNDGAIINLKTGDVLHQLEPHEFEIIPRSEVRDEARAQPKQKEKIVPVQRKKTSQNKIEVEVSSSSRSQKFGRI